MPFATIFNSSNEEHPLVPRLGDYRRRSRTAHFTVTTMTTTSGTVSPPPHDSDLVLRLAASAYLGRYTGSSRTHTESDLRSYFGWCRSQGLAPLSTGRAEIERYVRWWQEVRRFKASTVSWRMAVVTGLPDLRHRRGAGALSGPVCPPPRSAA